MQISKRKIFTIPMLLLLVCLISNCRNGKDDKETKGRLYFLDTDETQVVSEEYEPKGTFKEALVQEYVEALKQEPKHREYKRLLPENVEVLDYSFGEAGQLILNFNVDYGLLSGITEILIRAAVVKTFCQIESIDYVEFYVNGIPYMIKEVPVGMMQESDFIDNTGNEGSYNRYASISIYFVNEEGTALRESQRQVSYNGNISREQLVVEQLLAGPIETEQQAGMYSAMPAGVVLNKVSTKDGVCYLDLNEKFLEKPEGLSEEAVIYSVVNSLVELSNINKVQFRINGETKKAYQSLEFSEMFERNLDIIETEN